jgi:S1-C subfamily serine protease
MSDSPVGAPDDVSGDNLPSLHREVLRPTSDRGRLAALATICSLAGVALGFALAGTMFASIPVASRVAQPSCALKRAPLDVTPAWLGVGVRSDGPRKGAWVRTVRPGSPAAISTSIRTGDVIVGVDGRAVTGDDDLVYAVRSRLPGTVVDVTVARGTATVTESLRLEQMPPDVWRIEQRDAQRKR